MARSGRTTFCCGAGGAHMWMEERGEPINAERVREAAATGAGTLAVACPYCTVMLDDGVQASGDSLRVVDVATLLAEVAEIWASTLPSLYSIMACTFDWGWITTSTSDGANRRASRLRSPRSPYS